jgi:hypothetical protein
MPNLPAIASTPWGTALDNYLSALTLVINVKDSIYAGGAKGDGVTDDTAAIAAARSAANAAGGGLVFWPNGTYITGNQPLYANVHDAGAGIGATIIKLKNGSNADLFSAQTGNINLGASFGAGSAGTLYNFGFHDLTLDGNKANQSATSYVLRFYGYGFNFSNVVIRNGYTDNVLSDWNGGSASPGNDSMEAHVSNLKTHDAGGAGWRMGGPHDSIFVNFESFNNGSHNLHIGPNVGVLQFTNAHFWGSGIGVNAVSVLAEGPALFSNCQAEGSDVVNVVLLATGCAWDGGEVFGAGTFSVSGFQIGQQAGNTPYPGQVFQSAGVTTSVGVLDYRINTFLYRNEGTHGAIWFANDGGGGFVSSECYQTAGNYFTGTPTGNTMILLHGRGLTVDGSQGKGGAFILPINAFSAFVVRDDASTDIFSVNTNSKRIDIPNATIIRQYSDAYSTRTVELSNGTISTAQSATAPATATNGTITTSGVGVARVAPAGNITGVILQAGTLAGQEVVVVNESAFTVTFATAGTSNVADGVSAVIAANRAMFFVWDSSTSKWYHA